MMLTGNEKVLIGIPTKEGTHCGKFYDYVDMIQKLPGSFKLTSRCHSPAKNRNIIIQYALDNNFTHVLFIDDDVAVPEDIMIRLINHDKDMVTGLYMMRSYPHRPILFDVRHEDNSCNFIELNDKEEGSLIPVVAAGLGCCLINTNVFRGMEKPWITLGEFTKDDWDDDISFFHRAYLAGFNLFADLSVRCGHMCSVMIVPQYVNGKWAITYDTMGTKSVAFPLETILPLVNA